MDVARRPWKCSGAVECSTSMELTSELRVVILAAYKQLKAAARRRFMAEIVRELGPGGQRRAEEILGWDRGTIRKGEHELRSGVECLDGRAGNKRRDVHDRHPQLSGDIKAIVDCWSQTDPRFQTPERYSRLSVPEVVERLIREKGYEDRELPSNETIRTMMHQLGYRLRKVQKAKPKKSPGDRRDLRQAARGERRGGPIAQRPTRVHGRESCSQDR